MLLLFDGHSSHTQNLNVVLKAREYNVSLICLPSHCTHRLQPLDVAFFKSLNVHYDVECLKWLREHPEQKITEERIPGIFPIAYGKLATVATAVNGVTPVHLTSYILAEAQDIVVIKVDFTLNL